MVGERKYETIKCKYLELVRSVVLFGPYTEGAKLTIRADCEFLKQICILLDSADSLKRWGIGLFKFEMDVGHYTNVKHHVKRAPLSLLATDKYLKFLKTA